MKMKPGLPEAAALALDLIKATWPVDRGQRRVGEAWWALERAIADDPGPDMLEALGQILWKLERDESMSGNGGDCVPAKIDRNDAVISAARAIIAKATEERNGS